jgi:hypothetical protein
MKRSLVLILLLAVFVACGSSQETAEDFIPTYEIVWCKANYDTLLELGEVLENEGDEAFDNAFQSLSIDEQAYIKKISKYLEETVLYIAPQYEYVYYEAILAFDRFLDIDVEESPDDLDLLKTGTSICTNWYNSVNN